MLAELPGIHKDLCGRDVHLTADPSKVHMFLDGQSLLCRDRPTKNIAMKPH